MSFGAPGELVFRSLAEGNALARIKTDRTSFERIPTVSFLDKGDVSPDGEWVIIHAPATSDDPVMETLAVPIRGGVPRTVCRSDSDNCTAGWSPDGNFFYVGSDRKTSPSFPRRTFAIPVPAGKALPDLSLGGITDRRRAVSLPRGPDDRGRPDLARISPLDLRLHQDRFAAQSLSHTPALILVSLVFRLSSQSPASRESCPGSRCGSPALRARTKYPSAVR